LPPLTLKNTFRLGAWKNRYGFTRDLIKIKYLKRLLLREMHTQSSVAYGHAYIAGEIHDVPAIFRNALHTFSGTCVILTTG
jgi:hypothetical protein